MQDHSSINDSTSSASRSWLTRHFTVIVLLFAAVYWCVACTSPSTPLPPSIPNFATEPPTSQLEPPSSNASSRSLGKRNEQDEQRLMKTLDATRKLAYGDNSIEPLISHIKQVAAFQNEGSGIVIITTDATAEKSTLGDVLQLCFRIFGSALDETSSLQGYSILAVDFLEGSKITRISAEMDDIRKLTKKTIDWKQFVENYVHFENVP